MMLATSKHVFKIKTCRNLFKNYDLLSAVSAFWYNMRSFHSRNLYIMYMKVKFYTHLNMGSFSILHFSVIVKQNTHKAK